jgi:hypothetical protein
MSANDKQIGGAHYQKAEYQHWDWVCDIELHYLLACATKYVTRWRDKNGVQDLDKAIHYLEKARERGVRPPRQESRLRQFTFRFVKSMNGSTESAIIWSTIRGDYSAAASLINRLKADADIS